MLYIKTRDPWIVKAFSTLDAAKTFGFALPKISGAVWEEVPFDVVEESGAVIWLWEEQFYAQNDHGPTR